MTLKELNTILDSSRKITLIWHEVRSIFVVEACNGTLKYDFYEYYDHDVEKYTDTQYRRKKLVKMINNGLNVGYKVL